MEPDGVLIFTRVVEYHSFTQAAQSLGIQEPTASRCIALLKERLGVRLLSRATCKSCLTEVGQACYERYRQITHDLAEAEQAAMQLQQAPSGLLRITSSIEFGQMFLASLLGDFMCQYPQVTTEVELASCSVDLLQEGVDTVIMVGQPEDSILVVRRLLSTSRWLCASPDYLVAYGTPTSVAESAEHHTVLLSTDSQRYWPLSGDSLSCQWMLSCNDITFICEAVVTSVGIATLPALICTESVYNGRLVRLLADVPLLIDELYAIYPSWRFQAAKVEAFLDFLISRLPADTSRLLKPEAARLIISRL